mmetsp:Transcript_5018/g.2800  ORF Transcript_5018/g.2800 Transcript_5018/m.2800 type:complete len:105 (+) Transcript_5018:533-847(+)
MLIAATIHPQTPSHLSENILLTYIHLINHPITRQYTQAYLDVEPLLAVFTSTESIEKEADLETKLKLSLKALVLLMRSWPGLIYLLSDPYGLKSIINAFEMTIK